MGFLTKRISNRGGGIKKSWRKAQSLLEYVLVIGIVSMAIYAMTPLMREGIQSIIKVTADQFANQQNAEQTNSMRRGYLVNAYTSTNPNTAKTISDVVGDINYAYSDSVDSSATSYTNLGYTNATD